MKILFSPFSPYVRKCLVAACELAEAGRRVVIVHAFVKKSQQTPDRELKLARKRVKELLNG